jgi:hypothetical protein
MARYHRDLDDNVQQTELPSWNPLVSAADLSTDDFPVRHIPEERLDALGIVGERIADQSPGTSSNHMTGKMGEDGFLKMLGETELLDTRVIADGGDGGTDVKYNGNTSDIKTATRRRTSPPLTVDVEKSLPADHYVLASRIGPTDVRLIGYAPRWVVANAKQRTHDGDDYHVVPQRDLIPFPDVTL